MFEKTRQFVKQHQTSVTVAATALVTWKLTRDATIKQVVVSVTSQSYEWGAQNGMLHVQNSVMKDFIRADGKQDELLEYVRQIKEVVDQAA